METLTEKKAFDFYLRARLEARDREEEILLEEWFNEFYPLQNNYLAVNDNMEDINDENKISG